MHRIPVTSSNIRSIGYEESSMILEVEFTSGEVYQYFNVPSSLFQQFLNTSSKGSFLNDFIAHNFRYQRIR
jgi:hypothetical protein